MNASQRATGERVNLLSPIRFVLASIALAVCSVSALHAQGILTVTPGRTAATAAGTGSVGDTGDGGAATSATLAAPRAVAYDANGNLYIADTNNHVIREVVKSTGNMTTIAGTGGVAGYGGDGAAATSAYLDTPTGVAVDSSGNIYIADSHNQRIREVSGGTITTIAGTGVKGFGGDNGPATSALLALPSAVAVDTNGNVYIADTNNHRIRKISGGTITTIAGDGEELYFGDGGAATSAALDSPTGVAVDAAGNVYIADRLNQRIREVSTGGTITTIAGSGTGSFSGGFSGDGASATAATLAKPTGVSVDSHGNIYVTDTNNQVVREVVNGGAIQSIEGSGTTQGYGGDAGVATSAVLNAPRAATTDANGNLAIADSLNERIRSGLEPGLAFGSDAVGVNSSSQAVTLANTGSASISVSTIAFNGAFTTATGGTCPAVPITLAASASCTQNIIFLPTAPGATTGSVVFSGTGVVPESILLSGTGTQATSSTVLTSSATTVLATQSVTFTATVTPQGIGTPGSTDTVTFYDGSSPIGSPVSLGSSFTTGATLTTTLPVGSHVIKAVYSGDTNFATSTSNVINFQVQQIGTTTALTAVPSVVVATQSTTLTAIVTPQIAGTPGSTDTVTFLDNGSPIGSPVSVGSSFATGVSLTTTLPLGNDVITAVYSGDTNFTKSTSNAVNFQVQQAATTTVLTAVPNVVLTTQPTTLTAIVTPQVAGTPGSTDTVTFLDNGSQLGSPISLGSSFATGASLTIVLPVGNNVITAVYSGNTNFAKSTSNATTVQVQDFNFSISSTGNGGNLTIEPGQTGVFNFSIAPLNGPFTFPVTLSATGLPSGATVIFNPPTITLGSNPTAFTMSVSVPAEAKLSKPGLFGGSGVVVVAMLLAPFGWRTRRKGRKLGRLSLAILILLSLGMSVGLTGCGTSSGWFGQAQQSYTINVIGTATSNTTTLTHSTTVTLTVE